MEPKTLRTIVAVFLFIHAIGHMQGVFSALGLFNSDSWHPRSWLFDDLLGETASRNIALMLMVSCVVGFLATAFAFVGIGVPHAWWRTLAIIFSIPSVLGLIFYWNILAAFFNKVGAISVNSWILIGVLILQWPSEAELGL